MPPFKSQAQAKLMFAAAAGTSDKVPKKVAKEFIEASRGQKVSALPKKKRKWKVLDRKKD